MRTDKHKLKPLTPHQEKQFLDVVRAYQDEKNYFSDQLSSHLFNHSINLKNNCSYIDIRNSLVKQKYCSRYRLPARLWRMALKEAYDLHIRTYERQIAFLKDNFLSQAYRYFCHHHNEINEFKAFFMFAIRSAFYNYSTFKKAEQQIFDKKFNQAKIYERTARYLVELLPKTLSKEILTKAQTEALSSLFLQEQNNEFFHSFCHLFISAIKTFRAFKPILSHKNPTIQLDCDCYNLYSVYDEVAHKNRWFLDIMSLEKGQRIKGLELTGFHHAKHIIKHSANLTLSFDSTTMDVYAHFTFENKKKKANAKSASSKSSKNSELLIGGDFGLTESMTFSDGFALGRTQGKILKDISKKSKESLAQIQKFSLPDFFGMERKNKEHRRNHLNNCFNHNLRLKNINTNYRKRQKRDNKRLEQFKYSMVNEMIRHFMSNTVYGNYQDYLSKHEGENQNKQQNFIHFVFESLDYSNLGRNKEQKRQINLIKGMYARLEEKTKNDQLPFKVSYVNSAYTSQMCPNCYYVAKGNRNNGAFRCLHCGYTVLEDEKFQCLRKVIPTGDLPPEDDFIASQNIRDRLSSLPDSLKQHRREIEEFLKKKHEEFKGSCKVAKV